GGVAYNRPLVLVAVGRRTGRERSVVLPFFPTGGRGIAVVGSRGGAPTDPYWARNLRAHPEAHVSLRRREDRVRARLSEGEERAAVEGDRRARPGLRGVPGAREGPARDSGVRAGEVGRSGVLRRDRVRGRALRPAPRASAGTPFARGRRRARGPRRPRGGGAA